MAARIAVLGGDGNSRGNYVPMAEPGEPQQRPGVQGAV
jgi:hypothetical protein